MKREFKSNFHYPSCVQLDWDSHLKILRNLVQKLNKTMCSSAAYHARKGRFHRRHHAKRAWKNKMIARFGFPPVNVNELDDNYEVQLFAAGYEKEDFKINLKDNLLVVSVEKFEKEDWNRGFMNFQPGNFERQFELNDKIDKDTITAKYENGVLTLTLPKLEGFETVRKDIDVN